MSRCAPSLGRSPVPSGQGNGLGMDSTLLVGKPTLRRFTASERLRRLALGGLAFALVFGASQGRSFADETTPICAQTGLESVMTDQSSYPSGSTVHISGSGYAPGCYVIAEVRRPDGSVVTGDGTNTAGSDTVVTDADGNLAYDYIAKDVSGVYVVNAVGADNVVLASTTFVDAAKINTLRLGGSSGPEDYVFVAGNVVFAEGSVDNNKYYKFVVRDPSGSVV